MDNVAKYVRLKKITYPDAARDVDYYYASGVDEIMSRVSSIFDDADDGRDLDVGEDVYASYKYLGAGTIVEEDYADIEVKLTYLDSGDVTGFDRFGRVEDQIWSDYGASATLDRYTYTYDRMGNRTAKVNTQHTDFNETYTYDDLDRLESATRADSFDQSWTLDGQGNFTVFDDDGSTQTRDTNAANEIISSTGITTPTYDAAGNIIADGTLKYEYDAWNRQIRVREADNTLIVEYEYDGANRRIEKTFADDSSVEYYYNQQWQLLEERFIDEYSATTVVNQYVWSQRYIDAPVVRFHDGNADGDVLDTGVDSVRYYTTDANYNVTTTVTIDPNTTETVEHYVYTAYGEAEAYNSTWSSSLGVPTEDGPLYCGYFFDSETANYQVRNRMYNTSLATWLSRDPIGYEGGINLYQYCSNNPLIRTDPIGLDPPPCNCPPDKADLEDPDSPTYAKPETGGWVYPHWGQVQDESGNWVDDPKFKGYALHCSEKVGFLYVTNNNYCFGRCPYPEPDEPKDDPNRYGRNIFSPFWDAKGNLNQNKFWHSSTNPTTLERIYTLYEYDPKTKKATITVSIFKCKAVDSPIADCKQSNRSRPGACFSGK